LKKDKIYFASDFHLGSPNLKDSHTRERKIISWLCTIEKDAKAIYLVGDIFDFWFEYKKVVPKGFVRVLGKLAEMCDQGININFIVGNHDMWVNDYFQKEIGLNIFENEILIEENNQKILICHGDGLGSGNISFKIIKKIFKSNICRWLFSRIHPNLGVSLAHLWSNASRRKNMKKTSNNHEHLINYCKEKQKNNPIDFYVFGHLHSPNIENIDSKTKYINTGDWIQHCSYGILSNKNIEIKKF